tara:strand:- start:478 stop:756 length:279 start_codon:yes stop_codon:yes gene_type:complete
MKSEVVTTNEESANRRKGSELKPGDAGSIIHIDTRDEAGVRKLLSLGVAEGRPIQCLTTWPVPSFLIGYSEVAFDRELTELFHVELTAPKTT